jgi:hypothetical protein
MMSLTGAPPAPTSTLTDGSGVYTLGSLSPGSSYTVTPTKASKPPGTSGINTSDSIAIQRHFLILGTPLTGCRLLAADTNDPPNGIATGDAIAAQRFFLGLTTGIAQTGRYKFSPVSTAYAPIVANQTSQNYNAVILGDAATAFVAPRPGGPEPDAAIENEIASTVAYVSLDRAGVSSSAIDAKSNLVGFQGDFTFDERVVTLASLPVSNAGLTAGNWNVSGNVLDGPGPIRTLRVSAFSLDGAPLSGAGVLFKLNMVNVNKAAQGAPLVWAPAGEPFVFIDADLNTQRPGHGAPSQR